MVGSYDRLTTELKRSCLRIKDELLFTPQRIRVSKSARDEIEAESRIQTATDNAFSQPELSVLDRAVDLEQHDLFDVDQHVDLTESLPLKCQTPNYYYHIEIPSKSKFFRVGHPEYVFISMLDGKTSFAHALAVTAQKLGPKALSENQATQTVQWLLQNGLADFADDTVYVDPEQDQQNQPTLLQKLNPFWLKLPLGHPDKLLEIAHPYFRWLFHPVTVAFALLLMLLALVTVFSNWDIFIASSRQILSPSNWIWMLLTWVVLKVVHEFAHGLVCKGLGGRVKETGIIFILFAPMAYVDVTSSWRFSSRWSRIAVALAGMYVELLIASICVFMWCYTTSATLAFQLYNIIFMASFTTIVFNANPLMRFDGYYALSDLLRIPNLYTSGSASFANQMRWVFYGQFEEGTFKEVGENTRIIAIYGTCAAIWKVIICVSLGIGASVMFGGLGILLALLGALSWFGRPAKKVFDNMIALHRSRPQSVFRAGMVTAGLLLVLASCWFWIPNPFSTRGPCVVDFGEQAKIRANSGGFVEQVLVQDGQMVAADQPLVILTNHELATEVAQLKSELEQHKTRERIAIDDHNSGQAQIERRNRQATQSILNEKLEQANQLIIKAPVAGRVIARNLNWKQCTFIKQGDIVLTIGDENNKEIILSIGEDDAQAFGEMVGKQVPIQFGERQKILAKIKRIEPKASVAIRNECLITPNGGTLVVRQSDSQTQENESEFELCSPRFHAIASVDKCISKQLFCGQRGSVLLESNAPTIGKWVYQSIKEWLENQLRLSEELVG